MFALHFTSFSRVLPLFLTDFNLFCVFPIFNMLSKSETSYDKRQLIIFHHIKKKSYTEIAKIVQLNRNTIESIVQRYKKENRFEFKKRSGCPNLITHCETRIIIRKIKNNPKLSALKLNAKYYKETKKNFRRNYT